MPNGSRKKRRIDRVTTLELPPGVWGSAWEQLQRGHVLARLGLCALTAVLLWAIGRGWDPPLPYHLGDVPHRDIVTRTQFKKDDEEATREARAQARSLAIAVYDQDPAQLDQLRAKLENEVSQFVAAKDFAEVESLWDKFHLELAEGTPQPTKEELQQQYQRFREALSGEGAVDAFKEALAKVFAPLLENGLLDGLPPEHNANEVTISVRPVGIERFETQGVAVSNVLIEGAAAQLQKSLQQKMPSLEVANHVFAWLRPQLPVTLKLNLEATQKEQKNEVAKVEVQTKVYPVGTVLWSRRPITQESGATTQQVQPIDNATLDLLNLEYQTELDQRRFPAKLARSLAVLGMYVAVYVLCGSYIYYCVPQLANELGRLATLLALVVLAVALMVITSHYDWRATLIPLMLFGMTIAIAYEQEPALLLTAALTLIIAEILGTSLADSIVLMATTTGAILLLRRVRSRSTLLLVGFVAALVAILTALGVGTLEGEPFWMTFKQSLLWGLWAVIAGSLMTCLLPVIERAFKVQTDLSLIELGDPAHPLLQELIRRAPGTYNHSITVASLAESAAEAIGARGLLVRVGAYFHDIGKMLKPGYFVENQGQGDNRHRSLVPAMSTLVIIAHVKDGADLARQSKIPDPIIDFIQQHHGTTLVEYFYRQASESKRTDPNANAVDESSFRYPGPKPQSKEAGILMLADAVESASRVLVGPTPARIESLVKEICRKRLLDGQLDECDLTLEEVHKIGESLVKSLTAVYHGRVKYPDQETA
ncbi:MAG: HDIG domain-containing protein [Planctomycetes bacterium]|nr:HDIG domain-containing protein [Planctomycetota bacterium]